SMIACKFATMVLPKTVSVPDKNRLIMFAAGPLACNNPNGTHLLWLFILIISLAAWCQIHKNGGSS
ncbi:hypothetical protein MKW98_019116, partial [Papaver atlanticum]